MKEPGRVCMGAKSHIDEHFGSIMELAGLPEAAKQSAEARRN
jgi:hypothetical protein